MAIVRFKRGDGMPSMTPEMLAYLDAMTPEEIEIMKSTPYAHPAA